MELSITLIIVIATALTSIGGFSNQRIIDDLIFYPPAITRRRQWYRFFSSGLIHADWFHLIFNMIALYSFGVYVEKAFQILFGAPTGGIIYLVMYISALLISILPTYIKHRDDYHYRSLGASGAVSAVLFVCLILEPTIPISIFPIPIGIPGYIFGPLYLVISQYLAKRGGDNINHSAHIWGAVYGIAFVFAVTALLSNYNAMEQFIWKIRADIGV